MIEEKYRSNEKHRQTSMNLIMQIIWYNPDLDEYQKGTTQEFEETSKASENRIRFSVLYQFNENSKKLADKILNSLNLVRANSQL